MAKSEVLIKNSEKILTGLLGLGMLGILYLIVFGNLSGNLGFEQDTLTYANQTILMNETTGATPSGASGRVDASLSSVLITNVTSGVTVPSSNYTTSGVVITATSDSAYNGQNVNVSFMVTFDSQADVNTEGVIANLTSGTRTFFGFSPTFFTLTAITLLIGIVLTVIRLVKGNKREMGGGFSG